MLLCVANAAPVVVAVLLRRRCAWPVDGRRRWRDGERLLGRSKTWRGLAASLVATAAAASGLGHDASLGLMLAALAMAGDLAASFAKRRLKLPSGASAVGLDQLPESVLPLCVLKGALKLDSVGVALVVVAFLVLDLIGSRLVAPFKH